MVKTNSVADIAALVPQEQEGKKYWTAWKALSVLGARVGNVSWSICLLPLKDEDVWPLWKMDANYYKKKKKDKAKEEKSEGFI